MNNRIPVESLGEAQNQLQLNSPNHIENEQKRSQLVGNIQKNLDLHFNSPNYRTQNPITFNQMPQDPTQKIQKKQTQFSGIDHLSGYPEPQVKPQKSQGQFQHYKHMSNNKQWKSSSKFIDFKPTQPKPEQNHIKMTNYYDKYKRNPIFEGEIVKSQSQQGLRVAGTGDQSISGGVQYLNNRKNGFNGERYKKVVLEEKPEEKKTFTRVFSPSKNNNKHNNNAAPQINEEKNRETWAQSSKEQLHQQGQKVNQEKNATFFGGNKEMWPLRSDIPSKKQTQSDFAKSSKNNQGEVFKVMHYDYGMPHGQNYTQKPNSYDPKNRSNVFSENNAKDYRRKYNVLQKEENLAGKQALQHKNNSSLRFY